jgi:hypothetical protein
LNCVRDEAGRHRNSKPACRRGDEDLDIFSTIPGQWVGAFESCEGRYLIIQISYALAEVPREDFLGKGPWKLDC